MPILFMGLLALVVFIAIIGLLAAASVAERRQKPPKTEAAEQPIPEPQRPKAKAAHAG
jgi:Na+-transporting methylmalonyl-CoA/oxaloacetate decarboxylase gamma subunit